MHFKLKSNQDKRTVLLLLAIVFSCCNIAELMAQKPASPDINASVSGAITCANASVKLSGSSKTPGVYFVWTGPGGYYSTAPGTLTTMPGEYTLTVKDAVNNTTSTATVRVLVDTIAPKDVIASVSGFLTCKDTLVTLTGNSSTSGVTFDWQGPKNYRSAVKDAGTALPGMYLLKVINPVNGCYSTAKVGVDQNITPPAAVTANVSDKLTCTKTSVTLTGSSTTKDAHYHWSGQGFKSEMNKTVVSNPGTYVLTVINPVNGCESVAKINVEQNIAPPGEVLTEVSDTLTCKTERVTIKAISSSDNIVFNWSGPNNVKSTESMLTVSGPGLYKVTVTNQANGCSVIKTVTVPQDTTPPVVNISATGDITCINKSVILKDSKEQRNYTYNWSGPGDFTSTLVKPEVKLPGSYYVTVTNTTNGCSVKKSVTIKQNTTAPANVTAKVSGTLSCARPKVTLDAVSSIKNALFSWAGPKGFASDKKNPVTAYPGSYTLEVSDPVNGCKSLANITVAGEECLEKKN
jgi:hypothetical protein